MSEFKASNGIRRDFMEDLEEGLGYSFMEIDALAEFFQHKRDEELGRWRWPENPEYVVYLKPKADDRLGRAVYVFNERSGEGFWCWEADITRSIPGITHDPLVHAVRAFFEAHPETKPWHDAKPGEVWVLTANGDTGPFITRLTPAMTVHFVAGNDTVFVAESDEITSGRRIWPEVD